MGITYVDVIDIAPEIPASTAGEQARITRFISRAACRVSSDVFGDCYNDALAYMTAHMMTVSGATGVAGMGAAAGPVASEKVGDVETRYAVQSGQNAGPTRSEDLGATAYGRAFLQLRSECVVPMLRVNTSVTSIG